MCSAAGPKRAAYLHRPVVGTAEAAAAGSGEAVGAVGVGCAAAG